MKHDETTVALTENQRTVKKLYESGKYLTPNGGMSWMKVGEDHPELKARFTFPAKGAEPWQRGVQLLRQLRIKGLLNGAPPAKEKKSRFTPQGRANVQAGLKRMWFKKAALKEWVANLEPGQREYIEKLVTARASEMAGTTAVNFCPGCGHDLRLIARAGALADKLKG